VPDSQKRSERMMRWFRYQHLPDRLGVVSKQFCDLADWIEVNLAPGPERTVCLRKLLEAKDAGVRAHLEGEDPS